MLKRTMIVAALFALPAHAVTEQETLPHYKDTKDYADGYCDAMRLANLEAIRTGIAQNKISMTDAPALIEKFQDNSATFKFDGEKGAVIEKKIDCSHGKAKAETKAKKGE